MTTKERISLYHRVASKFRRNTNYSRGICDMLNREMVDNYLFQDQLLDEFPEFALFKPDENEDRLWWWDREDGNVRQVCLLFCIEMAKNP